MNSTAAAARGASPRRAGDGHSVPHDRLSSTSQVASSSASHSPDPTSCHSRHFLYPKGTTHGTSIAFAAAAALSVALDDEPGATAATALLPLCLRRLRGPGRVRRAPPGTAYRSAGAVLHRVLRYNADGEVRVEVVREYGLAVRGGRASSAATAAPETSASSPGAPPSRGGTLMDGSSRPTPHGVAVSSPTTSAAAGAGAGGVPTSAPTAARARRTRTKSQARREHASQLATDTERHYTAELESTLAALLQALPLLRVVPPQCLLQQAYTHGAAATPDASSGGAPAFGSPRLPPNTRDARHPHSATPPATFEQPPAMRIRGADGLGLSAAVLLGPEEALAAAVTSNAAGVPSGAAPHAAQAALLATAAPATPTHARTAASAAARAGSTSPALSREMSPATSSGAPTPPLTRAASSAAPSSGTRAVVITGGVGAAASAPAGVSAETDGAVAAALNGMLVDGGLGVTIKLGASCDDAYSLRCVTWGGCRPALLRAVVWRVLSDYAPATVARQRAELQRKRRQYEGYTRQYCSALTMLSISESLAPPSSSTAASGSPTTLSRLAGGWMPSGGAASTGNALPVSSLSAHERAILHQMLLDLPRHQSPVFHARRSVAGMARCLFLWSQRHPAVGYVQGMDDVVAIFYQVFLADALRQIARDAREAAAAAAAAAAAPACVADSADEKDREANSESGADGEAEVVARAREKGGDDGAAGDAGTRAVMRLLVSSLSTPSSTSPQPATSRSLSPTSTPVRSAAAPAIPATAPPPCDAAGAGTAFAALSPFMSEADVDVIFDTPAALDTVLAEMPESYLTQVEADTYVCAGRVLSLLQDNFMPGQPGIMTSVRRLDVLVRAVDPSLIRFLDSYGLSVMDGCFQWLHCLLARELPLTLLLRLWDCYLAIGTGGDRAAASLASSMRTFAGPMTASSPGNTGGQNMLALQGGSASDEAIMQFHVCVCCALLRSLHENLVGPTSSRVAASSAAQHHLPAATPPAVEAAPSLGWAAALSLATALTGRGARGGAESGTHSTAAAAAAAAPTGAPTMDVVMTTLKRPFEALFPRYAAAERQVRTGGPRADAPASAGAAAVALADESAEYEAAMRWLDVLIADAYCIWRQHPLPV